MHELLGKHKASAEWYTPDDIWARIERTFATDWIYDPCPINGTGGLDKEWGWTYVYINPPTPAAPWAQKAIQTFAEHPEVNIIFAAFSESVLWQVNELMDYEVCWVRNRIRWIDGKTGERSKAPRNYNAFVLLSKDTNVSDRFRANFSNLGTIRRSYAV